MKLKRYWPGKRVLTRRRFFDSLAQPFYRQGDEVGCVVLHGFTGTPANVRVVADKLAEAGYTVYAPLLQGHGTTLADMDTKTAEDWIQDAEAAYDKLIGAGCKRIFLMGLSMGGVLASLLAQERPCDGLVLMSTPFRMRRYLHSAMRVSPMLHYIITQADLHSYQIDSYSQGYPGAPLRKLFDLERLTVRARGGLYKLKCPILILQSAQDNRVDLKSVPITQYGVNSTDITTIMLQHSPHGCSFGPERDAVAAHCLAFVQRILNESRADE